MLASSLPIDIGAFDVCMGIPLPRVEENVAQARRLGIEGTPAFMLGSPADDGTIRLSTRINGVQQLDVFVKAIDELAGVTSARSPRYPFAK
jgi:predicted DsbA family dithiol-disulfide isomerase